MGIITKFAGHLKRAGDIATAMAVVAGAAFIGSVTTPALTHAAPSFNVYRDCSSNSVLHCGAMNISEVQKKYKSEKGVKQIYAYYHISASDIANLGHTAVSGYATKSGDVVVNGKVVARNAFSAGRNPIYGSKKAHYDGVTFYNTASQKAFLSGKIHGYVVLNHGEFKFMILASCGNSLQATPTYIYHKPTPKPTPKPHKPTPKPTPMPTPTPKPAPTSLVCKSLEAHANKDDIYSYNFTIATSSQNATITGYSINFGDNNSYTGLDSAVGHTYTKAGNYEVTATVNGKLANGKPVSSNAGCQAQITIVKPTPMCTIPGKENLPADSDQCVKPTPKCQIKDKENLPANSSKCAKEVVEVQPTRLVNTGPGEVIAIFIGSVLVATIGSRLFLKRRYL